MKQLEHKQHLRTKHGGTTSIIRPDQIIGYLSLRTFAQLARNLIEYSFVTIGIRCHIGHYARGSSGLFWCHGVEMRGDDANMMCAVWRNGLECPGGGEE